MTRVRRRRYRSNSSRQQKRAQSAITIRLSRSKYFLLDTRIIRINSAVVAAAAREIRLDVFSETSRSCSEKSVCRLSDPSAIHIARCSTHVLRTEGAESFGRSEQYGERKRKRKSIRERRQGQTWYRGTLRCTCLVSEKELCIILILYDTILFLCWRKCTY